MKRTDLTVGMDVHYVENSWQWNSLSEDVVQSIATVVDLEHYFCDRWGGSVRKHRTGKHIRVKVGNTDRYVTGAQLKGPYAEVALQRAAMQKDKKNKRDAENARRKEREQAVQAVAEEAQVLGFETVMAAYRDRDVAFVELTAAELHAMLAEVRKARSV